MGGEEIAPLLGLQGPLIYHGAPAYIGYPDTHPLDTVVKPPLVSWSPLLGTEPLRS